MEYTYDNYGYHSNDNNDNNDYSADSDNEGHQQSKNRKRNVIPKKLTKKQVAKGESPPKNKKVGQKKYCKLCWL